MSDKSTPSIDGQLYDFEEIARLVGLERSDAARRYDSLIDTYRRTKGASRMPGAACRWPLGLSVIARRGRREPAAPIFSMRGTPAPTGPCRHGKRPHR